MNWGQSHISIFHAMSGLKAMRKGTLTPIFIASLVVLLTGCATPLDNPAQREVRTGKLVQQLLALSPEVKPDEAQRFARAAVEVAADLGRKYDVTLHPWLHNASIHLGLKQRGFCYEYANDLYDGLKDIPADHLALHFIEANKAKLNEHHALSVTVAGAKWDSGVVLDAWRYNGNLYFLPVKADTKYPWKSEVAEDTAAVANSPVRAP